MKKRLIAAIILLIIIIGVFVAAFALETGSKKYEEVVVTSGVPAKAVNGGGYIAQNFTIGNVGDTESFILTGIQLRIGQSNAPTNINVSIVNTDANGVPDSEDRIAFNDTVSFSVGLNIENITFPESPVLRRDKVYAILVSATGGGSDTVDWNFNDSTSYSGGESLNSSSGGTNWNAVAVADDNVFQIWGTSVPINVVLDNPINKSSLASVPVHFNSSVDLANMTIINATLNLWNSSNSLINESVGNLSLTGNTTNSSFLRIDSISTGHYTWNTLYCGVNGTSTLCSYAEENLTLGFGVDFTDEHFINTSTEGSTDTFQINFTVASGESVSSATLINNETRRSGTITQVATNDYSALVTFSQPALTGNTNVSSSWEILLASDHQFNSTNGTQEILNIEIDDCGTQTVIVLNYTLKDEETQVELNISDSRNSSIKVDVDIFSIGSTTALIEFSQNYTNNRTAQVCVSEGVLNNSNFRMDAETSYTADDYAKEFHHIQNNTLNNNTIPNSIDLLDLLASDSTEFLMTVKDEDFLPLEGAIIDITRKYVDEGKFKTVEIPLSDASGQAIGHFDTDGVLYTINVRKNGKLISIFDNIAVICNDAVIGDCKLTLSALSAGIKPRDFTSLFDLSYFLTFDESARTLDVTFSNDKGENTRVGFNVTKFDRFGNNTVCTDSLTATSGTISCTIPDSFGNLTVVSELWSNQDLVTTDTFTIEADSDTVFGGEIIVFGLIMAITIPLMFITSAVGVVVGGIIGFIASILLFIFSGGSILGELSSVLWLILAAVIIIFKINQRGGG